LLRLAAAFGSASEYGRYLLALPEDPVR